MHAYFVCLFGFFSHQTTPDYKYFGTEMDTKERLDIVTGQKVVELSVLAAQVAGQMALRLVHDHTLRLDVTKYGDMIESHVKNIINHVNVLKNEKVIFIFIHLFIFWARIVF